MHFAASKYLQRKPIISIRRKAVLSLSESTEEHDQLSKQTLEEEKKRKEALSLLSQNEILTMAISILQRKPRNRTDEDLEILMEGTKNVKFFQDLVAENGKQIHMKLCKNLYYQKCAKDEVLFNIGEVGSTFYIILKGQIGIVVPIPVSDIEEDKQQSQPKKGQTKIVKLVMTEVKQLGQGVSFGELAILGMKPRAATIVCKEETQFAVLDKVNFNKILGKIERNKLTKEIGFFQEIPFLQQFDFRQCQGLLYNSTVRQYQKNEVVFYEGEEAKHMYIIKAGEFQHRKLVKVQFVKETKDDQLLFDTLNDVDIRVKASNRLDYRVSNMQQYAIFGESEIINRAPRFTTVQCLSPFGTLVIFRKKEFYTWLYHNAALRARFTEKIQYEAAFRQEAIAKFTYKSKQNLIKQKLAYTTQNQKATHPQAAALQTKTNQTCIQEIQNQQASEIPAFQMTQATQVTQNSMQDDEMQMNQIIGNQSQLQNSSGLHLQKVQQTHEELEACRLIIENDRNQNGSQRLQGGGAKLTLASLIRQPDDQYIPNMGLILKKYSGTFYHGVGSSTRIANQKVQLSKPHQIMKVSLKDDREQNKKYHVKGINSAPGPYEHYNPFTRIQQVETCDNHAAEIEGEREHIRRKFQTAQLKSKVANHILRSSMEATDTFEMRRFVKAANLIAFKTKIRMYMQNSIHRLSDIPACAPQQYYKEQLKRERDKRLQLQALHLKRSQLDQSDQKEGENSSIQKRMLKEEQVDFDLNVGTNDDHVNDDDDDDDDDIFFKEDQINQLQLNSSLDLNLNAEHADQVDQQQQQQAVSLRVVKSNTTDNKAIQNEDKALVIVNLIEQQQQQQYAKKKKNFIEDNKHVRSYMTTAMQNENESFSTKLDTLKDVSNSTNPTTRIVPSSCYQSSFPNQSILNILQQQQQQLQYTKSMSTLGQMNNNFNQQSNINISINQNNSQPEPVYSLILQSVKPPKQSLRCQPLVRSQSCLQQQPSTQQPGTLTRNLARPLIKHQQNYNDQHVLSITSLHDRNSNNFDKELDNCQNTLQSCQYTQIQHNYNDAIQTTQHSSSQWGINHGSSQCGIKHIIQLNQNALSSFIHQQKPNLNVNKIQSMLLKTHSSATGPFKQNQFQHYNYIQEHTLPQGQQATTFYSGNANNNHEQYKNVKGANNFNSTSQRIFADESPSPAEFAQLLKEQQRKYKVKLAEQGGGRGQFQCEKKVNEDHVQLSKTTQNILKIEQQQQDPKISAFKNNIAPFIQQV